VKEAGVPIGGANERQNLAVFISSFSCFVSGKGVMPGKGTREGWRYVPERDFDSQVMQDQRLEHIEKVLEEIPDDDEAANRGGLIPLACPVPAPSRSVFHSHP
jgi:hypothetical protein